MIETHKGGGRMKKAVLAVMGVALASGCMTRGPVAVKPVPAPWAGMVKVESVALMREPMLFAPAPIGIAAKVRVDGAIFQSPIISNIVGKAASGWLLIGADEVKPASVPVNE